MENLLLLGVVLKSYTHRPAIKLWAVLLPLFPVSKKVMIELGLIPIL
jgi:hypothetical protein